MDDTSIANNNLRRAVICKVFEDLSNFINSPLTTTGNKVNIYVRNINNVVLPPNSPNGVLGLATGFYNLPSHTTLGGIADNEVWKTIHTGVDSYANVSSPLTPNSANTAAAGSYYHGMIAFNFNLSVAGTPLFSWHTNLTTACQNDRFDLYTIALHEITHALGFASLINNAGNSKMGNNFKYFSRYDQFLKSNNNLPLLTSTNSCTSSMYDYRFNSPALNLNILQPQTTPPSACIADNSVCTTTIKYQSSSNNVPVYTPNCFSDESSLSHFEDQCFNNPATGSPYGNNNHFVMSNANGMGVTKRFLKSQERTALCDMGYSVKNTYGSTVFTTFNYGGAASCGGIIVAGTNDGINVNGTYTFTGNVSVPGNPPINIQILGSTLLVNDRNATNYECLQDLTTGLMISTNGNNASIINFSSTIPGLHLLRYVPTNFVNNITQRGNITYVYVYFTSNNFGRCIPDLSACDLVFNGGFENHIVLSGSDTIEKTINEACGWSAAAATPDYFNTDYNIIYPSLGVPCNFSGFENVNPLNNPTGNAYAGAMIGKQGPDFNELFLSVIIKTRLSSPLAPNTTYNLRFDVSLAERFNTSQIRNQIYLSDQDINLATNFGQIPIIIAPQNYYWQNPTYTNNFNGWQTITHSFTTTAGGAQYLYLGAGIQGFSIISNPSPAVIDPSCLVNNSSNLNYSYCFYDNISLKPVDAVVFNLPFTIACPTKSIPNLALLINGAPTNGVFTSPTPGITLTGAVYSFNTALSGIGMKTITYTYTNNLGCVNTIIRTINVVTAATLPSFNIPTLICAGSPPFLLPTVSTNGVIGTWSPTHVTSTNTSNYTFTPNYKRFPCSVPVTITVTVGSPNSLVANNDLYSLPNNAAATTNTILVNDTSNGSLINVVTPNISIIQVGTAPTLSTGGITLNSNGTITILPNSTIGTYTLQYQINSGCSTSNIATITVKINAPIVCPSKHQVPLMCYSTMAQTQPLSNGFFNPNLWGNGIGILVNGLPGTPANVTITPTSSLPPGITINPNGTFSIAAGVGSPITNTFYSIFVNFCVTGFPNICTPPVEIYLTIGDPLNSNSETFNVNNSSAACANGITCPINVLANDYLCDGSIFGLPTVAGSNVTLTALNSTYNFAIDPNTGQIVVSNPPIANGQYILNYQVCVNAMPAVCEIKMATIIVGNTTSFKGANNPTSNSIIDKLKDDVVLFPNPSSGKFTLSFGKFIEDKIVIEVYNFLGQMVHFDTFTNLSEFDINLEHFANGAYILKIAIDDQIINKQLIKN